MSTEQEITFQNMNEVLPEGWVKIKLIDIVDLNLKAHLDDSLEVGFTPMASVPISFREQAIYEKKQWKDVKKGYTHFKNGDVIFAKITPCFENSKAAIIENYPNKHGAGSTEYFVLTPKEQCIHPKLLLALVKSKDFLIQGALNMSGSVGHKRVPKEFVENYSFFLPPLAEQQEIATRLDDLLTQVDAIKARLDAIPAILKRFRQAVLAAAVSGKLTDSEASSVMSIDKIAQVIGGLTKNSKREILQLKKPYLRVANVYENELRLDDISYIGIEEKEIERVLLRDNDLLVVEGNGSLDQIGRVALWQNELVDCVHQNHIIKVRVNFDFVCPKYLLFYLMSPQGKKEIVSKATSGAGLYTLSISKVGSIKVPLFQVKEQTEIVNRVEQLFAFAGQIEQQVQAAQTRVNQLTQAILAKAFKGELTAAWRVAHPELISGENSAEALLEKIKVSQIPAKPKRGKTTNNTLSLLPD